MKTQILFATALAILAQPAIASAADGESYGSPGQLEAGGVFGISNQSSTYKPDGGDESTSTFTLIRVSPTVGYYVSNGFEVLGELNLLQLALDVDADSSADDKITGTLIGLGAGAGYFFDVGMARIGPQATLRFGTTNISAGDFKFSEGTVGASVGGFAKVPIGGGGVIAAGLVVDYNQITQTEDDGTDTLDSKGTSTDIGARVGYFVFF